jgi:hypothetical protein
MAHRPLVPQQPKTRLIDWMVGEFRSENNLHLFKNGVPP